MLLAVGCAERVERPAQRDLPRLDELRGDREHEPPPEHLTRGPTVQLRITRFAVPRDASLTEARALLDEQGAAPSTAALWADNGMHVRVIDKDMLDDVLEAMPMPVAAYQTRMSASNVPTPLDFDLQIRRPQRCVVTLPGGERQTFTFESGQCRLLVEGAPDDDGPARVMLTPQHYEPQVSVRPRSVLEKQLDGRVFEKLRIQLALDPDKLAIVTPLFTSPPDNAPEVAEPPTSQPAEGAGAEQPTEQAPPPGDLGRLIMEASRHDDPLQLVLIVGLEPDPD